MKQRIDRIMGRLEEALGWGGVKKDIALLAIGGIALLISLFEPQGMREALPFDPAWIAIVLCGIPILCEAVIGLVTEFDITADVLVAIALIASVAIGETFAAGEVAFIMQFGGLLEELTVERARAGIEKLVHLTPRTARLIARPGAELAERVQNALSSARIDGTPAEPACAAVLPRLDHASGEQIAAESVQVGDLLRVNPGETVPVDGVIVAGQTSIDQSVMTGESIPVDKAAGDEVSSGTLNQFGSFDMVATRVGEDSSIQRMIRLVQSADASKANVVRLADRWAVWIVIIALSAAAVTWVVTGEIIRAVTILVVFCPCALVLATPTAIMAAIGNATKHGFMVREGDALERLASVRAVALDKTGTLTYGTPRVVAVESADDADGRMVEELFALAASAETKSEHPLGRAIVAGYRARSGASGASETLRAPASFSMIPGRGVEAVCMGESGPVTVIAGNLELMAERSIDLPASLLKRAQRHLDTGCTVTYAACLYPRSADALTVEVDGAPASVSPVEIATCLIALSDVARENARDTVARIRATGAEPVLLTGDNEAAAAAMASRLDIRSHRSGCTPEDKLAWIDESEHAGRAVCMVGDGVNDAPALKRARVGIAMGGIGSDIAVDAADIALVSDDVAELPHLLTLSRRMISTIKINMTFSMALNFIAIALAITGVLNPVVGALVHNAGSVLVISNSALLLGWKRR